MIASDEWGSHVITSTEGQTSKRQNIHSMYRA